MLRPLTEVPAVAPAALTAAQAAAVQAMRDSHVPLDVLLMAAPVTDPPDVAHRAAVAAAVARFAAERGRPDDAPPDLRRLLGCRLSPADLLGRRLDPGSGRLLHASGRRFAELLGPDDRATVTGERSPKASGPYRARGGDADRWLVPDHAGAVWGLADVLAAAAAPDRVLAAAVEQLLAGAGDDVEAYRFVGNWSTYFDDADGWGEALAWTVRTDAGSVVVIGASWTD